MQFGKRYQCIQLSAGTELVEELYQIEEID